MSSFKKLYPKIAVRMRLKDHTFDIVKNCEPDGQGIILKPYFEVISHLNYCKLLPILQGTPPPPLQLGCLYPHHK